MLSGIGFLRKLKDLESGLQNSDILVEAMSAYNDRPIRCPYRF